MYVMAASQGMVSWYISARPDVLCLVPQDFAQWLVQANTNLAHPPCEPEWDLQTIISQAR